MEESKVIGSVVDNEYKYDDNLIIEDEIKSDVEDNKVKKGEIAGTTYKELDNGFLVYEMTKDNLPQVDINLNRQAVLRRNRKEVLDALELKQNRKFFGDSKLMKKIKTVANAIESTLELSMPLVGEELESSLTALNQKYDELILYCEEYESKNGSKTKGLAKTRLDFVREIYAVTSKERKNLPAAVKKIKKEYPNVIRLNNWQDAILYARSDDIDYKTDEYTYSDITDMNQTKTEVAISRMADYIGASDIVISKQIVKDGDSLKLKTENRDINRYHHLSRIDRPLSFKPEALAKLQKIHNLEEILGIRFTNEQIFIKIGAEVKPVGNSRGSYRVDDIVVKLDGIQTCISAMNKNIASSGLIADREVANRIMGMDPDIMSRLFSDVMTEEQKKLVKDNVKLMIKRSGKADSVAVGKKDWSIDGESIANYKLKSYFEVYSKSGINDLSVAGLSRIFSISEIIYLKMTKGIDFADMNPEVIQDEVIEQPILTVNQTQEREEIRIIQDENIQDKKEVEKLSEKQRRKEEAKKSVILDECYKSDEMNVFMGQLALRNLFENSNIKVKIKDRTKEKIFDHEPCVDDIKQGFVGDCYLLSALTAIVKNNPQYIKNMFEDKGDYVLVKFPSMTVPVSKNTYVYSDGEGDYKDVYAKGSLWVQLIEKAYGRVRFKNEKIVLSNDQKMLLKAYGVKKDLLYSNYEVQDTLPDFFRLSVAIIAGGEEKKALQNITGQKFTTTNIDPITVDNMGSAYSKMWKGAKAGERGNGFGEAEKYIQNIIQGQLKAELLRRHSRTYRDKDGNIVTNAYRSLTIENIKDTLLDIKNWVRDKGDKSYADLYKEVKSKYYNNAANFTESSFMDIISGMAEKLEKACDRNDNSFEHESYSFAADGQAKYSKRARTVAAILKEELKKGIITCGTQRFMNSKGDGLNAEQGREGIAEGHAYSINGLRQLDNGQIFLQMRNPWGYGTLQYTKLSKQGGADVQVRRTMIREEGKSTFEIELNDFLRFFRNFDTVKNVKYGTIKA